MLTHRSRDWSAIKESMRRERTIQDLLRRSGATRLHRRVTATDHDRAEWRRSERRIVATEKRIRDLDPSSPLFWAQYCKLNEDLLNQYQDAGVSFDL
jgi:hypothetical protein